MASALGTARMIADHVRFSGDHFRNRQSGVVDRDSGSEQFFSQNSMQITAQVTPALAQSIEIVCDRLELSQSAIKAYVYASSEAQAYCVSDGVDRCFVGFSSGLVDLLEPSEMEFVAGHELGHFLLRHSIGSDDISEEAYEMKMLQRAQEISADRLGLIACGSLDVSIKALMKTVSGLTSEHLRFDVSEFIAQIRKLKGDDFPGQGGSSHPSMLVRCRALLWFSLSRGVKEGSYSSRRPVDLDDLDNKVSNDLTDYVDGPEKRQIELWKKEVSLWLAAKEIVLDGRFDKMEQEKFATLFGLDNLAKLKVFLDGINSQDVKNEVEEKLELAKERLSRALPHTYSRTIGGLENLILRSFR